MDFFLSKSADSVPSEPLPIFKVIQPYQVELISGYGPLLKKVSDAVGVPEQVFDMVYKPMFKSLVLFCQHLPMDQKQKDQCFYEHGLKRAAATIIYYAPLIKSNNGYGFDSDRLMYALCSAAMLHGVGNILQQISVEQTDRSGFYLKTWYPNISIMEEGFYRIRPTRVSPQAFIDKMNLIYAQVILPSEGLAWIMEDPRLYLIWEKALIDFNSGFDELEAEIVIKEAHDLDEIFDLSIERLSLEAAELAEAEKFWSWLKEQVEKQQDGSPQKGVSYENLTNGVHFDLDQAINLYATSNNGGVLLKRRIKETVGRLGVGVVSGNYLVVDSGTGLLEKDMGSVYSVQSQSAITSSEQFCARVGGVALQFMLGHTSHKK
ncbi:hypothetical protein MMH89_01235 [Candidatus Comchoanobacter bicostacola]|uniref:Phosphohydrolase n=1 Tax=Candidatus Comchoanobacter bicostacola TaxID=2919598 RepID=A0ABY5DM73_9GAMM|nr:hypothetical protein [Candidatus Comchoanobacter bicostacola]UTC24777.1 hypothetical protein MMH89_01235 [Candidatus Comchoanobacter bicostacola]